MYGVGKDRSQQLPVQQQGWPRWPPGASFLLPHAWAAPCCPTPPCPAPSPSPGLRPAPSVLWLLRSLSCPSAPRRIALHCRSRLMGRLTPLQDWLINCTKVPLQQWSSTLQRSLGSGLSFEIRPRPASSWLEVGWRSPLPSGSFLPSFIGLSWQ